MKIEECITIINKTIEQLESFGYQWSLDRADELKRVVEYIKEEK